MTTGLRDGAKAAAERPQEGTRLTDPPVTAGGPRGWRFFVGVFVLLLAWSLANPMFAAPDEDLHLARSQSTWRGDLTPPYSTDGLPVRAMSCFAFQPNTTADCMDTTWGEPTDSQLLPTTNGYPPFFSVVAGAPTRLVDGLAGAYVVRIWLALLSSLILTAALRRLSNLRTDGLGVAAAVVALTPMSVFLMASVNPSGLSIAFGALAVASGLAWRKESSSAELAVFGLSLGAIVLLRRDGLVIAALLGTAIVVPSATSLLSTIRKDRTSLIGAISVTFIALAVFINWSWDFLVSQLTREFSWANWRMTLSFVDHYLRQLVGIFGWVDTLVSEATLIIWFVCVGALVAIALMSRERRSKEGVFLLASCVALPVTFGFFRVQYFQTRYVLPLWLAGFVLYVALHVPDIGETRQWRSARRFLMTGVFLTQQTAFLTNMHRYSHGVTAEWSLFTEAAWEPPGLGNIGALLLSMLGSALFAGLISTGAVGGGGCSSAPNRSGNGR